MSATIWYPAGIWGTRLPHNWPMGLNSPNGGAMQNKTKALIAGLALLLPSLHVSAHETVNDVTQLNPVTVDRILTPTSLGEIVDAVKTTHGPISIGGARHSQGGQISEEHSLHLDMRHFNRVVALDPGNKTITVQSGITWREIQDVIDPYNLSVKIMQTYSNFTVGGSLSVNCHGRYVGAGPIILSVLRIQVVLPDGRVVEASPEQNRDLFYGVIGGYGALGVITEATLRLVDNTKVERSDKVMPISRYKDYFLKKIRRSPKAVFHNGDIYPPDFQTVRAVTWSETDKPVTIKERLIGRHEDYTFHQKMIGIVSQFPFGKQLREYLAEPLLYIDRPVAWRNHEASYDALELEPPSRARSTQVLQEYFVPVERFDDFYPKMIQVLKEANVNVINISIRHALPDPGSLLAWAKREMFAFVLYYEQGTTREDREAVGNWTRKLISAALSVDGSYYLPYQVHATDDQFREAYPRFGEFFALKKRLDPENKFRNKLWDTYYGPAQMNNSGTLSDEKAR